MKFDWRYLGFACAIIVFALMARLSYSAAEGLQMYASADACMVPFVAGAVVYLMVERVLCLRSEPSLSRGVVVGSLAGMSAFGGFLTVLLGAAGDAGSATAAVAVTGSYALFGIAMAAVLLTWGDVIGENTPERVVVVAAASWIVSVFARWPLIACTSAWMQCVLLAFCLCLSLVLLALLVHGGARRAHLGARAPGRLHMPLRSLANPAVLGLCLAMFHTGAVAIPSGALAVSGDVYASNNPAVKPIGCMLAVALIAAVLARMRKKGTVGISECVALVVPACIVCIGCFAFTRMVDARGVVHSAFTVLNNVGIMGILILFLPDAVERSQTSGISLHLALMGEFFLAAVFFFTGYASTALLGNGSFYILIFLALVFSMVLALGSMRRRPLDEKSGPNLEERCDAVALERGLTGREHDVLVLLACGYRDADIAQELGISPSTAHTYRKAVYAKLDVHRSEELILLTLGYDKGGGR